MEIRAPRGYPAAVMTIGTSERPLRVAIIGAGIVGSAIARELARYLGRITMEMAQEPYADIVAHPFYRGGSPEENCSSDTRPIVITGYDSIAQLNLSSFEAIAYTFTYNVPVPAAFLLFLSGLAGLVGVAGEGVRKDAPSRSVLPLGVIRLRVGRVRQQQGP